MKFLAPFCLALALLSAPVFAASAEVVDIPAVSVVATLQDGRIVLSDGTVITPTKAAASVAVAPIVPQPGNLLQANAAPSPVTVTEATITNAPPPGKWDWLVNLVLGLLSSSVVVGTLIKALGTLNAKSALAEKIVSGIIHAAIAQTAEQAKARGMSYNDALLALDAKFVQEYQEWKGVSPNNELCNKAAAIAAPILANLIVHKQPVTTV